MQTSWRKSSHSYANGNCVQVAARQSLHGAEHLVRDSQDPDGPVLAFSQAAWNAFLRAVNAGQPGPRRSAAAGQARQV